MARALCDKSTKECQLYYMNPIIYVYVSTLSANMAANIWILQFYEYAYLEKVDVEVWRLKLSTHSSFSHSIINWMLGCKNLTWWDHSITFPMTFFMTYGVVTNLHQVSHARHLYWLLHNDCNIININLQ